MAGKNKGKGGGLVSTGVVAQNRRARFDFAITETIEAGIMLLGTEVKSLRLGRSNVADSYAGRQGPGDDLWLINAYIPEYTAARHFTHEPKRPRKLLVRRREAIKMLTAIARDGMTLVPLSIYFNERGLAKVSLGLGKGKKTVDKRETIKQRDWERQKSRVLRDRG